MTDEDLREFVFIFGTMQKNDKGLYEFRFNKDKYKIIFENPNEKSCLRIIYDHIKRTCK